MFKLFAGDCPKGYMCPGCPCCGGECSTIVVSGHNSAGDNVRLLALQFARFNKRSRVIASTLSIGRNLPCLHIL